MRKNWIICLALCLMIPALLFTASCTKTKVTPEDTTSQTTDADAEKMKAEQERLKQQRLEEERQKALDDARRADQQRRQAAIEEARQNFINSDVYFDFDSAVLSAEAQAVLREKAAYLTENPGMTVEIGGHCDERGTNEYNMALGERRALAANAFLMNLGIDGARLQPISYGEERAQQGASDEATWARDRRAHFEIR